MEKIDILDERITNGIAKIPDKELQYELSMLFGEYKKQVGHKIKEVKKLCRKKRK